MGEGSSRPVFTATYKLALRLPELASALIADRERQPEVRDVLRGSLDHLWRNILTPDDGAAPARSLDPQRKSWLLLHAGLLRGANLALITSWRASGDTLDDLEHLYPGFLEYGVALNAIVGRDASRLATAPGEDRLAVRRVADESRALLDLGLRRGYSLGFLLDLALSAEGSGEDVEPGVAIRRALAARALPDDSETAAALATNGAVFDREASQAALEAALRSDESRAQFEAVVGAVSRQRPLAVPTTIGRYSEGFVCSMLSYLIAWWFAVGLAAGSARGAAVTPASALGIWRHYSVRRWVDEQSLLWARKEAAETLAVAGDADALRWRLAGLTQCAAALGWRAVAAT